MTLLLFLVMLLALASLPVGGTLLARRALARREEAQKLLVDRYAHLSPVRSWRVAYSSQVHVRSVFKFWSWEDVGVLHLYPEALAFYGEHNDLEVGREEVQDLRLSVFHSTNPLVYWVEVETTTGLTYNFCLPQGYHVFGMKERAAAVVDILKKWAAGSAVRPLLIE